MRTRCWISGVLFATQASAAGFVITVQVYNAANATNLEIRKALDGAGSILRQAGVEARWIDCVSTLRDRMVLPVCVQRSEPGLFVLSILPEDPRGGGNALGFAVLTGRRNGAAVIYPRVVTMFTVNPQCGFRGMAISVPNWCQSRFRSDADQCSKLMPIVFTAVVRNGDRHENGMTA